MCITVIIHGTFFIFNKNHFIIHRTALVTLIIIDSFNFLQSFNETDDGVKAVDYIYLAQWENNFATNLCL